MAPRRAEPPRTPAPAGPPDTAGFSGSAGSAAPAAPDAPACPPAGGLTASGLRFMRSQWLAVLAGALCYLNALPNGFVYDDVTLVENNPRIRDLTDFRALWLTEWWHPGDAAYLAPLLDRLYRPLTLSTFALNYALNGLNPVGYHLVNLLLHAAVCGLVWRFVYRLSRNTAAAALAGLLFAVHPVHVDAVAGIVGRAEILAALFLLGGLLLLRPPDGRPSGLRIAGAAACFLAALLAKETAICYPALALLVWWDGAWRSPAAAADDRAAAPGAQPGKRPAPRRLMAAVVLLLPLLVYFPLRVAALGGRLMRENPPPVLINPLRMATPGEQIWSIFTVFGHYVRLLLVPADLSSDYGYAIIDPAAAPEPLTWLGLAAAAGLLGAIIVLARQRSADARLLAVLAGMFLASYALIANAFFLIGVAVAERLMYWPSVLFCAAAGVALVGAWRGLSMAEPAGRLPRWLPRLGVAVLMTLALRTAIRNHDWRSNLELFGADVARWPAGVRLNEAYANELLRTLTETMTPEQADAVIRTAEEHLRVAQRLYSSSPAGLLLYAKTRALQGDVAYARMLLERAVQLAPQGSLARQALAELEQLDAEPLAGRIARLEAEHHAQPDDVERLRQLGELLVSAGRWDAALEAWARLTRLLPEDSSGWIRLGEVHAIRLDHARAQAAFEQALRLAPDSWQAHSNLALALGERDPAGCLRHAELAWKLRPDDLRVQMNYAEALVLNRRTAEAVTLLRNLDAQLPEADPLRALVRERLRSLPR